MISMKFLYTTDKHYDFPGWLPENAPRTFTPLDAMGAVHDLMEHRKTANTGSTEEELHALGVMLYIRGAGGYWHGRAIPDVAEHLAAELARLPEIFRGQLVNTPYRPGTGYACDVIERAMMLATKEWEDEREDPVTPESLPAAKGYLLAGYRWARSCRYRKLPPHSWTDSFRHLEQCVARLRPDEGDRIRLDLCLSTGQARLVELEPDWGN